MLIPIGTAFGYGTRTHTLSRTLPRREASRCAVRPQSAAQRARHGRDSRATRALAAVESTASGGRLDHCARRVDPFVGRVGDFQRATRQHRGPLARSSGRSGGSTRRGAAVHSVRRGARGGGRLAGGSRPPPLPVPPALPLQALPTLAFVLNSHYFSINYLCQKKGSVDRGTHTRFQHSKHKVRTQGHSNGNELREALRRR